MHHHEEKQRVTCTRTMRFSNPCVLFKKHEAKCHWWCRYKDREMFSPTNLKIARDRAAATFLASGKVSEVLKAASHTPALESELRVVGSAKISFSNPHQHRSRQKSIWQRCVVCQRSCRLLLLCKHEACLGKNASLLCMLKPHSPDWWAQGVKFHQWEGPLYHTLSL